MNVPTKLIDTTIEEFKAEGYTARVVSTNIEQRYNAKNYQVVNLIFEKAETDEA